MRRVLRPENRESAKLRTYGAPTSTHRYQASTCCMGQGSARVANKGSLGLDIFGFTYHDLSCISAPSTCCSHQLLTSPSCFPTFGFSSVAVGTPKGPWSGRVRKPGPSDRELRRDAPTRVWRVRVWSFRDR